MRSYSCLPSGTREESPGSAGERGLRSGNTNLGSTRLVTAYPTPTIVECDDYYPYGEANANVGGCLSSTYTQYKFTGDERDLETNLDHTWFRQNSSTLGRWMTPDPAGLAAVNPGNPQSWNRYAYVMDNPLGYVDQSGLGPCPPQYATYCNMGNHSYGVSYLSDWGRAWDEFDLLQLAFTPTGQVPNDCPPGGDCAPQDRSIPVYGNLGLLNLTGGPCYYVLANPCGNSTQAGPNQGKSKVDRLKSFNACVGRARVRKNSALRGAIGEMAIGGVTTLAIVGLGGASLPAFYTEAAASPGIWASYEALDVTGRFALFSLPGLGTYGKGIFDATAALNQFDGAVATCQADNGYPNVP